MPPMKKTPPLPKDAALILVDVQRGFDEPYWGRRNNPGAEKNVARLLAAFRAAGRPVFHVQHLSTEPRSPLRPDRPGHRLKDEARPLPGEPVVTKSGNSAFIGTDLERRLRRAGVGTVVLAGITTNHCVSTTARMAGNLGFKTFVVSDATATFDRRGPDGKVYPAELMHAVGLAELHGEFAEVLPTGGLLRRLGKR